MEGPNLAHGMNDGLEMACLLMGERIVRAYYDAATERLTCEVPPRPDNLETLKISLEVRLNDVPRAWTEDLVPFEYFPMPIPISMGPTMAPRAG